MDKHKSKRILKFLDNMKSTGTITKDEVLTLENAIGENIVTSSVNIKELSSNPSKSGYDDVYAVVNTLVEKENITTDDITSINEAIMVKRVAISNLKTLKQVLERASSVFSEDVKKKMLDSKERYSFYNEKGELETDSYDLLEDYQGPRGLLFSSAYISSFTSLPIDKIEKVVTDTLCSDLQDKYNDSWYEPNVYGLSSVLLNNEFENLFDGLPRTYTNINGKSYISILENGEEILKSLDIVIKDLEYYLTNMISGVKNNRFIELSSLTKRVNNLQKINTIFREDRSTLKTLAIITYMLSQ